MEWRQGSPLTTRRPSRLCGLRVETLAGGGPDLARNAPIGCAAPPDRGEAFAACRRDAVTAHPTLARRGRCDRRRPRQTAVDTALELTRPKSAPYTVDDRW